MKKRNTLRTILLVCFTAVFLFSLYKVVSIRLRYSTENKTIGAVQEDYTHVITESDDVTDIPEDVQEIGLVVDFDALLNKNKDVIGWVYLEGTKINYPVAQSSDNNDYLRTGVDRRYSWYGTPFADMKCDGIAGSLNTIIYGHNMNNGMMFGSLVNYRKQSYYDEHKELVILTPEKNYRLVIVSANVVSAYHEIYSRVNGEACYNTICELKAKSDIKTGVEISKDDRFVTLSTCSLAYDDARQLVIGKLVEME
ncbi:MAG: class B sortase [Clostridia bacterium]|nr:class B sortase [Clostridia bacterium]